MYNSDAINVDVEVKQESIDNSDPVSSIPKIWCHILYVLIIQKGLFSRMIIRILAKVLVKRSVFIDSVNWWWNCVDNAKIGLDRLRLTSPKSRTLIDISNFCMCQNQRTITTYSTAQNNASKKEVLSKPFCMHSVVVATVLRYQSAKYFTSKRLFCEFSILINTDEQYKLNVPDVFSRFVVTKHSYRWNHYSSSKCTRFISLSIQYFYFRITSCWSLCWIKLSQFSSLRTFSFSVGIFIQLISCSMAPWTWT